MGSYVFGEGDPAEGARQRKKRTKQCPFCAEEIRIEAIKCRYCGEFLQGDRRSAAARMMLDAEEEEWEEASDEEEELEEDIEENDDDCLFSGRPSLFALCWSVVKTAALLALCVYIWWNPVAHYVNRIPQVDLLAAEIGMVDLYADRIALGLGLAALAVLAYKAASLKSTYYVVTADRVEWSRGLFNREVDNIDMFRVVDIALHRSVLDCVLGIGTVVVSTKDASDPYFEFVKVRGCRDLYDVLKKASLDADKEVGVYHKE